MADLRYSDKDLKEFEALIHTKIESAQEDLDQLQRSLSHSDDNSTEDTAPTFKMMEDGSETMSREETAELAARQQKFIQSLQNALLRIKNKTYGICRVTGKLIPKERLRLVPHATLSIGTAHPRNPKPGEPFVSETIFLSARETFPGAHITDACGFGSA